MKPHQEWATKIVQDAMLRQWSTVQTVKAIQLDALETAATLLTANADSPTRGFEAIHKLIVKLKTP